MGSICDFSIDHSLLQFLAKDYEAWRFGGDMFFGLVLIMTYVCVYINFHELFLP